MKSVTATVIPYGAESEGSKGAGWFRQKQKAAPRAKMDTKPLTTVKFVSRGMGIFSKINIF